MKRRTNVDAEPCFLPIFMLFGLGGAGRQGARVGNGARGFGGPRPYGPGAGAAPYGPGTGGAPYGVNPNMYGPRPGITTPGRNGPYGQGPQAGSYGGAGRWPMIF